MLDGLSEGMYEIRSARSGVVKSVRISADTTVLDIALPAFELSGWVVEQGSGRPVAEATVDMWAASEPRAGEPIRTTTNASGFFSVVDLEKRAYKLTVRKVGFLPQTEPSSVYPYAPPDFVLTKVFLSREQGRE